MSACDEVKVAFLGLGIMGSAMSANLRKTGASVRGWNRSPGRTSLETARAAGVEIVDSIEHAVKDARVIFSCVGDEHDSMQLLTGEVAKFGSPNALIVDMGTIGQAFARNIGEALAAHGLRFLDAPVTGGDVGAREGTLTILVGGSSEDFAECKPLFDAMGKKIFHCGAIGSGQAMKLCNQILCAVNMVAVSEAFALADAMDIDKKAIIDSLSAGAGGSWVLTNLGPRIVKGDFAPGFTLDHMLKDLRLVSENQGADTLLPGTQLAIDLFKKARSLGEPNGGQQGTQAMFRAYAQPVKVSSTNFNI